MTAPNDERRANARLLCDERFQQVLVHTQEGDYPVTAINFNHAGIGIFTNKHLPDFSHAELSFNFVDDNELPFRNLPCETVYSQDTEVGDQYGLRFVTAQLPAETRDKLERIAAIVRDSNDPDDRYGLFS